MITSAPACERQTAPATRLSALSAGKLRLGPSNKSMLIIQDINQVQSGLGLRTGLHGRCAASGGGREATGCMVTSLCEAPLRGI